MYINIIKDKLNDNNIDILKYDNLNNNNTNNNTNTSNSNFNNNSPLISKKYSNNANLNEYNKNSNNWYFNYRAFNNKEEENGIIKIHQKLVGNTNLDISANKRRNLFISLMNKQFSKTRVILKTSNNTRNYDITIDNEDDDNEKIKILQKE